MKEKIRAADIDWRALDDAAAALDAAVDARAAIMRTASRTISAAADTRAAEIERLNREGVPLALIARHLGISRQAISTTLARYRKRDQRDQGDTARDRDHT